MEKKARVIAFYLPQFHPVPVNDKYWGKGFTEWTNVAKAKPLFKGHYQPQIPADLGFYDLRVPQIREQQADMARDAGIEGFCYWNYWFGEGEKVLEMPIEQMMETHSPDYPFCVGWANHDWSNKTWKKTSYFSKDTTFFKQKYLGEKDYKAYFEYLLPMFKDERYIRINNKPLFYIYDPDAIPNVTGFIDYWNRLAIENGLEGIWFVARGDSCGKATVLAKTDEFIGHALERYNKYINLGFDSVNSYSFRRAEVLATGYLKKVIRNVKRRITGKALNKHDYRAIMNYYYMPEDKLDYVFPTMMPRRDRTPRSGENALVYANSTPEAFKKAVKTVVEAVKDKPEQERVIFLDSWNEWGEGSYMEPDLRFGHQYLDALKEVLHGEE